MSNLKGTLLGRLKAATGSALVGYNLGRPGAIDRLASDRLNDYFSIKDFGAIGDGSDATTAFKAAVAYGLAAGKDVFIPSGEYLISAGLNIPSNVTIYGSGWNSKIIKGYNGPVFSLAHRANIRDFYIEGDFINFTGVGVTVPFTAEFDGYQNISNMKISGTDSYCVEYFGMSGYNSRISNCELLVRNNATDTIHAIKWGIEPTNKHGNRNIINCSCGSGPLVDVSGSENGAITGNMCGGASTAAVLYSSATAKVIVTGNRFPAPALQTIDGIDNVFTNNVLPSAIDISGTSTGCIVTGNVSSTITLQAGAIRCVVKSHGDITPVDNSGSAGSLANLVDIERTIYNPVLTGSITDPVIGNGSLTGYFSRKGRITTATVLLVIGSTTTTGSGDWRFTLPFIPVDIAMGIAKLFNSGTNFRVAVVETSAGINRVILYTDTTSQAVRSNQPFIWAAGDSLKFTITYSA